MQNAFSAQDTEFLQRQGIETKEANQQWINLTGHRRWVSLLRPCAIDDGLEQISEHDHLSFVDAHLVAARAGRWSKFVPASGAASRMFAFKSDKDQLRFIESLREFAFSDAVSALSCAKYGVPLEGLLESGRVDDIKHLCFSTEGVCLQNLPKALVPFHRHGSSSRTPFEEHLREGIAAICDADGLARLHFTVAEQSRADFEKDLRRFAESADVVCPEVQFSVQSPSTDTISVDDDGNLARDENGFPTLRPGGHGALLHNLNQMKGDLIFVKNVDNVSHADAGDTTLHWIQVLGTYLVRLEKAIHQHLRSLIACGDDDLQVITAAHDFLELTFSSVPPPSRTEPAALRQSLISRLRRPIRVCGMVRNEGEPGGGPFWVRQADGSESVQIVETAEIDLTDKRQREIVEAATHFNPVFMALAVRDERGEPFDLNQFVDDQRVIITRKRVRGREVKVLEKPGLWNGAMAGWNSVFVEVPVEVFTPVKTVFDLLRSEHQPN